MNNFTGTFPSQWSALKSLTCAVNTTLAAVVICCRVFLSNASLNWSRCCVAWQIVGCYLERVDWLAPCDVDIVVQSSVGALVAMHMWSCSSRINLDPPRDVNSSSRELDMGFNFLSGSIPSNVSLLTSRLTALSVANNGLNGSLPATMSALVGLRCVENKQMA